VTVKKTSEENQVMKVHNHVMKVKEYETYLGDIICKTGSNDRNVENRRNQGISAISQIKSMLNRVSLGHYQPGGGQVDPVQHQGEQQQGHNKARGANKI
jgi:hypothetical protein